MVCLLEPNRPAEKSREREQQPHDGEDSYHKAAVELNISTGFQTAAAAHKCENWFFFNTGPQERFPEIRKMKKRCSLREDVSFVVNEQGAGESLHFS